MERDLLGFAPAPRLRKHTRRNVLVLFWIALVLATWNAVRRTTTSYAMLISAGYFTAPANPTQEESMRAAEAMVHRRPLPPGWTFREASAQPVAIR